MSRSLHLSRHSPEELVLCENLPRWRTSGKPDALLPAGGEPPIIAKAADSLRKLNQRRVVVATDFFTADAAGLEVRIDSASSRKIVRVRSGGQDFSSLTYGDDAARLSAPSPGKAQYQ